MSTFFKRSRYCFRKGFTLVELLVVVAVITIITAFVLFNQGKFNSATLLRSLGYSVALSLRQAQLYGTSVRGSAGVNFAPSYGVNFNTGDLALSPSTYALFHDDNVNTVYDTGEGTAYSLPRGYQVSKFCGVQNSGTQTCWSSASSGFLTIYFRRPNPDALFYSTASSEVYTSAYIELKPNGGTDFRAVKITTTGQITVCPLNTEPPTC